MRGRAAKASAHSYRAHATQRHADTHRCPRQIAPINSSRTTSEPSRSPDKRARAVAFSANACATHRRVSASPSAPNRSTTSSKSSSASRVRPSRAAATPLATSSSHDTVNATRLKKHLRRRHARSPAAVSHPRLPQRCRVSREAPLVRPPEAADHLALLPGGLLAAEANEGSQPSVAVISDFFEAERLVEGALG